VTPVTAESLSSLLNLMKRIPDNEANRQLRQKLHQKHINATQLCFAERALMETQNQFLTEINNEGKVRLSTKSKVLGTAKVMAWDDLDKARAELAAKEQEKEEKKARREAKNAEKEVKNAEKEAKNAEKAVKKAADKNARVRKRKMSPALADVPESSNKLPRLGESSSPWEFQTAWVSDEQQIAPVARMI
jgi:glutamine synthetase type III